ncbi:hypothetical protein [Citricoccus sp. I39-566]|uniref:hypothetical protein n=1 Tax=Citricoccus sp. I39-566 TaxID=3073268 RepID=UPI00286A49F4|nr:hypothetical protein [Citricoccus sp. I39-566]WMY80071.1 hypothetical protein RE421_16475 [Citricoccus sp. I39-566]
MTWVKRSGGAGTGFYDQGLSAAGRSAEEQRPPAGSGLGTPDRGAPGPQVQKGPAGPAVAPAYRVTQWPQVRDNALLLDLLAQGVATHGYDPEMSMYYEDALATFGVDSPHFTAACRGERGASAHYQRTVAGGRFREGV